jgi:ubiquitin carboxyl-terminal hydrolase 4/11
MYGYCIFLEEGSEDKSSPDKYKDANQTNGASSVSLYECLEFSQQPEQLEADNTWYCRTCKDHVRAYKSIQLYKTPKILIFQLKRFKASNRMFK